MKNLLQEYGHVIIAVLTCAVLFAIVVMQVVKVQNVKEIRDNQVLVVKQEGTHKHKAPVYTSPPKSNIYIAIDNISYDWNYFMSLVEVKDEKGTEIKDRVTIMVYKLLPDYITDELKMDDAIYIGELTKDNSESIYSLDNININTAYNITTKEEITDENNISIWGYKTYINSAPSVKFSGKYKLVYQVVDSNGYKAEYSSICLMESKQISEALNISISLPSYQNVFDNQDTLATEYQNIRDNTTAIITDANGQTLRNCSISIETIAVNSDTSVETIINNKDEIKSLTRNTLIRMSITATDTVTGQSFNKVIDLLFAR